MTHDREIYSLEEIIRAFDPKRIGVSGAFFDVQKLNWVNQQYLLNIPENEIWDRIKEWSFNDAFMQKLMPLCHTRMKTFADFMDLSQFLFINELPYYDALLTPAGLTKEQSAFLLQAVIWSLDAQEDWGASGFEKASHSVAEIFGAHYKKVMIPILYGTITGRQSGLPLFAAVGVLGKDRTRARLLRAIEFLGSISNKKMDQLNKCWVKKSCSELLLNK